MRGRWITGGWSLALLAGSVNAACTVYRPPPRPIAAPATAVPYQELWSERVGRGFSGSVATAGQTLFGGGVDRKVYAVDLTTGKTRWNRRLPGSVVAGVVVNDSVVFTATDRPLGRVLALRARDGHTVWQHHYGRVGTPLGYVNGLVLMLTREGVLLALHPHNGEIAWRRPLGPGRVAPVAASDSTALVATLDSLYLIGTRSGRVVARRKTPGTVVAGWRQHAGLWVAGTTDSLVVGLDPASLVTRWSVTLDAPVFTAPAVESDRIYAVTRIGTLYRLDPSRLEMPPTPLARLGWPVTTGPVPFDNLLLVGGADGRLRAIDLAGREVWRAALWQPVDVAPMVLGDDLLAIGGNGDMHRYRP